MSEDETPSKKESQEAKDSRRRFLQRVFAIGIVVVLGSAFAGYELLPKKTSVAGASSKSASTASSTSSSSTTTPTTTSSSTTSSTTTTTTETSSTTSGTTTTSTTSTTIANINDLQEEVPVIFDYPGTYPSVLIKQSDGTLVAFSLVCTHNCCTVGTSSVESLGWLTCPCHGSAFDASTGAVVRGPATVPLPSIELSQNSDGNIFPVALNGSLPPCIN